MSQAMQEFSDWFAQSGWTTSVARGAAWEAWQASRAAVVVELPDYHHQAMGCGLEDRGITDRYEACRHGFECALERVGGAIEDAGVPVSQ